MSTTKYKFTASAHDIDGFYGVDYRGLNEEEIALTEIGWNGWTTNRLQEIINNCNSLSDDEEFDYEVEGSDFYILVKKDEVLMWARDSSTPDITWSYEKFLQFLEDFKRFVRDHS